jgi:hypothetical protein
MIAIFCTVKYINSRTYQIYRSTLYIQPKVIFVRYMNIEVSLTYFDHFCLLKRIASRDFLLLIFLSIKQIQALLVQFFADVELSLELS